MNPASTIFLNGGRSNNKASTSGVGFVLTNKFLEGTMR